MEVYQVASIPGNGEELLKKQFLSSISRLGVGPIGPTPNLELLEKNCFLRRFHRKVAQECPPGCSTTLFSGGALRHRWHSETRRSEPVALRDPALRCSGTQTPGTPSRNQDPYLNCSCWMILTVLYLSQVAGSQSDQGMLV